MKPVPVKTVKEVLENEVFPALGCTEPIAVAYAASVAANEIDGDPEKIVITVDPGVYKNGMAVTVPNTNGQRGNLIAGVLGGMLCDGAKAVCSLKVVSSADSAIRSAYMALNNHGITEAEGFVVKTPEETIQNLSKISVIGMAKVDDTMLAIMKKKTP
jgi:L-cysteine desulfidase